MDIIKADNLIRNYCMSSEGKLEGSVKVLKGLNFTVKEQDFVGVMGKSGCGKTTLLKVLGLIDKPTKGRVYFKGTDTQELRGDRLADIRREEIGFIFQNFYLMDSLNVEENIMLPLVLGRKDEKKIQKVVREYAKKLDIINLLKKNPYELSGGEKQRVAICRALINNPDIILADEPTGNLDSKSSEIVIDILGRINQEFGKTIIMVTHDPMMASYCKRLILLKDGVILDEFENNDTQEVFYQEIIKRMAML